MSRRSIMTLFSAPDEPQSHRVRIVLGSGSPRGEDAAPTTEGLLVRDLAR